MTRIDFMGVQAQRARLGAAVEAAITRVLDHGKFIMGPEVHELEDQLAAFCGSKNVISCASGTDALMLALLAYDVGPGDAVFVPSFTFAATAECVALLRATPVFVDVLPGTFNLDPGDLRGAMELARERGLRAAGVIAVDLYGQPADYDEIEKVAADAGAWVIADGAQSFGARKGARPVGSLAQVTTTSFFPAKPLGCYGDGGAVFTDDDGMAEVIRSLRVHGQGESKYDNARLGINGRLDTIQAAVLLEKLKIFPEELDARQAVAGRYTAALAAIVETPELAEGCSSAWAQYTIRVNDRDACAQALSSEEIPTAVYYPRGLHQQPAYCGSPEGPSRNRVTESHCREVLSLPMHPYLTEAQQRRVIDAIAEIQIERDKWN